MKLKLFEWLCRDETAETFGRVLEALNFIQGRITKMSAQLDALTVEVQEAVTVQQSAVTLLKGLSDQIISLKNDPVALQALADSLDTSSNALAAAIEEIAPTDLQRIYRIAKAPSIGGVKQG